MWSFQWLNSHWQNSFDLSASDRGLAYGDGVFETFRITQGGAVPFENYHYKRLNLGLEKLLFDSKVRATVEQSVKALQHDLATVSRQLKITESSGGLAQCLQTALASGALVAKLYVSRGVGPRGYDIPAATNPTILLQLSKAPKWQSWLYDGFGKQKTRSGISLISPTIKLAHQPLLAGIKHCNRLEQVLARQQRQDADDVLLQDQQGRIIESGLANVCLLMKGQWLTPKLDDCGVSGVVRQWLLDKQCLVAEELHYDQLSECDAMMICNSVLGILPVAQVDHHRFEQADICSQWQDELEALFR